MCHRSAAAAAARAAATVQQESRRSIRACAALVAQAEDRAASALATARDAEAKARVAGFAVPPCFAQLCLFRNLAPAPPLLPWRLPAAPESTLIFRRRTNLLPENDPLCLMACMRGLQG